MVFFGLPLWAWWVIAALALVLIDLLMMGAQLVVFPAGLAALITAAVAAGGGSLALQIWVFALATLVLTPTLIWLMRRKFKRRGVGILEQGWQVGRQVTIERQGDRLVARLKSDTFPFRVRDDGPPAQEGEKMTVAGMEGITLIIYRPQQEK